MEALPVHRDAMSAAVREEVAAGPSDEGSKSSVLEDFGHPWASELQTRAIDRYAACLAVVVAEGSVV